MFKVKLKFYFFKTESNKAQTVFSLCLATFKQTSNCSGVNGLPPGLFIKQSSESETTTVTEELDKLSSSVVGSAIITLL